MYSCCFIVWTALSSKSLALASEVERRPDFCLKHKTVTQKIWNLCSVLASAISWSHTSLPLFSVNKAEALTPSCGLESQSFDFLEFMVWIVFSTLEQQSQPVFYLEEWVQIITMCTILQNNTGKPVRFLLMFSVSVSASGILNMLN